MEGNEAGRGRLAAMQPYFFPYIGYFQTIAAADVMVLYDLVQYIDRGWINRNRILYNYERIEYFGIPVKRPHTSLIKDIWILHTRTEQNRLMKIIAHNYKRAKFFDETYTVVEQALLCTTDRIAELNSHSLRCILRHLDVQTKIIAPCDQFLDLESELKENEMQVDVKTGKTLETKTKRILRLCQLMDSATYINPIGGTKLYSKDVFAMHGINLQFIQSKDYIYPQKSTEFVKHLSIIDVLMHCGKEDTKKLLTHYDLV